MRPYLAFLFSALALVGCGGGGGDGQPPAAPPPPPPPPSTTISGAVFASDAFTSGVVKAYDFTDGIKGAQLASGTLDLAGAYQLTITGTPGALLIEADSGCYREKGIVWNSNVLGPPASSIAVTAAVCTSVPSLSAAVPFNAKALTVAVTPFTHAALGLAQYEMRSGMAVATALNDASGRISSWVGVNTLGTLPAVPLRSSQAYSDAVMYGSLLAGIPTWLQMKAGAGADVLGAGTLTTLAFADAMKSDLLQDGVLNGAGRDAEGNAVGLTVGHAAMTTTVYRHQLAVNAALRIRAETEGAKDSTSAESGSILGFLPALTAYNNASNSLVDGSAVVALDEGGPAVRIGTPPGITLTGDDGIDGAVSDLVGISGNTVMLIDGAVYTPFSDAYHPNSFINTTIFANGSHVVTVRATNFLGHVGSASVTVNFFN